MRSLFFVMRMFSQLVNICLFNVSFNRIGLWSIVYPFFHIIFATSDFSISPFFIFLNCSLTLVPKFIFVFPIYLLVVLAIDLINSWFLFWRNVVFQVGIQKIFMENLYYEYYVLCCGIWSFCWIYYVPMDGKYMKKWKRLNT